MIFKFTIFYFFIFDASVFRRIEYVRDKIVKLNSTVMLLIAFNMYFYSNVFSLNQFTEVSHSAAHKANLYNRILLSVDASFL